MTEDDDAKAVEADRLEELGESEKAADLRLEIVRSVRENLDALFARLETAETRDERMAAMLRAAAAGRRAKQRVWTELVGQTSHVIARSDDPISALVGLACSSEDDEVREAAESWLADHGARELRLRAVAQLGRVPRNPTCATLEAATTQTLTSLCIPDPGTHVWTSDMSGTLCAIDLKTGVVETIAPAIGEIMHRNLATSNGRVYAALFTEYPPRVEVWNGKTLERTLEGHEQLICAIAADGVHLVVGGHADELSVWNVETWERTTIAGAEMTRSLAIRGDTIWAGNNNGSIRVFSIASRSLTSTLSWFEEAVLALAVDGDEVFAASDSIRSTVRAFGDHGGTEIKGLAVVGDRVISGGGDAVLRIWDRATGERLQTIEGHCRDIDAACVHPDNERILSCGSDGTVRVTDIEHALELPSDEIAWAPIDFIVPIDGDRMILGGEERVNVECRSIANGEVWVAEDPCTRPTVVGELAVAGYNMAGSTPHVRSCVDGAIARPLEAPDEAWVVIAGEDRLAIGGCENGAVVVWNIDTGEQVHALAGHSEAVRHIARAGDLVVTGAFDNTLRAWSLASGRCVGMFEGHTGWVSGLAIVDDRVVSWSLDKTLRVWDLATAKQLVELPNYADKGVRIPGTKLVALTSQHGGTLWILDTGTLRVAHQLDAHAASIGSLTATASYVATTDERSLAIWTHDLRLQARWHGRMIGPHAWLSPKRLALGDSHGEVVILELSA